MTRAPGSRRPAAAHRLGRLTRRPEPGDWTDLVVMRAASPWDGIRMTDRQVAERLAEHLPVLYVDPPISPLTGLRRADRAGALARPFFRRVAPRIVRLATIGLPGLRRPGVRGANAALLRLQVALAVGSLGGPALALLDTDVLLPTGGSAGERRTVFWAHDDFVAGAELMGLRADDVRAAQHRVAGRADVVVAASPTIAELLGGAGTATVVIPNGCDVRAFGTDAPTAPFEIDLPGPVAGVVGHLNERIDLDLLDAVARRGHSLLIVGPHRSTLDPARFRALVRRPNVRWVGPQPSERLPGYLRAIDVGLVPYREDAFNRASFPIKMLEYLAAGVRCVTVDLPAARWLDTDLIAIASGPEAFAAAVARELALPGSAADRRSRRAFGARHSWDSRAAALAEVLRHGVPGPAPGGRRDVAMFPYRAK